MSTLDIKGKPAACVCKSVEGITRLVERARGYLKGESFIVLLDSESTDRTRLLPAYINAVVRRRDGIARSETLAMEILLLISGDTNIRKAIESNGARDFKEFIVFSDSVAALDRFVKENRLEVSGRISLKFDLEGAGDVAMTELFED